MQAYNLQYVYETALILSLFVMLVVLWFLRMAIFGKITCSTYLECPLLELFWGTMPIFLLVGMCSVSTIALYVNDETYKSPALDVTVTGHQWYWSYKIVVGGECDTLEWDSRLIARGEETEIGFVDLAGADRPLMVPIKKLVRVFVTSTDVIHSWGATSLGIKIDAIPGRLTRGLFEMKLPGLVWGMCAELCGSFHSLMPTVIQGVPHSIYESWEAGAASVDFHGFWKSAALELLEASDSFKAVLGPLLAAELTKGADSIVSVSDLLDTEEAKNLGCAIKRAQRAYSHLSVEGKMMALKSIDSHLVKGFVTSKLGEEDIVMEKLEVIMEEKKVENVEGSEDSWVVEFMSWGP